MADPSQTPEWDGPTQQANDERSPPLVPTKKRPRVRPWGRLNAEDSRVGHVILQGQYYIKDKNEKVEDGYYIGRARACHLCLRDIKVSGKHARIFRVRVPGNGSQLTPQDTPGLDDSLQSPQSPGSTQWTPRQGQPTVFVQDLSTNGTFINSVKLGKGNERVLNNGDIISIAAEPNNENCQAVYTFQDMTAPRAEENSLEGEVAQRYSLVGTGILGTGAFSVVRRAVDVRTGRHYAIKIIDIRKYYKNISADRTKQEVDILRRVAHPNVVKIIDVYQSSRFVYIILELAMGGELLQSVMEHGSYNEDDARYVFKQILQGVAHLHKNGIVHRDLKPENILLAEPLETARDGSVLFSNVVVKITDFGLATIVGRQEMMKTLCGTPQYVAPEIIVQATTTPSQAEGFEGYDGRAVDMWSLGVLLYVLLSGTVPFEEETDGSGQMYNLISKGIYSFPDESWASVTTVAQDCIRGLMCVDVDKRLTAEQALEHPWVVGPRTRFAMPAPDEVEVSLSRRITVATSHDAQRAQGRSVLPAADKLRRSNGRAATSGPMSPLKVPNPLERRDTDESPAQPQESGRKRRMHDDSDDGAVTEAATDTEHSRPATRKRLF